MTTRRRVLAAIVLPFAFWLTIMGILAYLDHTNPVRPVPMEWTR